MLYQNADVGVMGDRIKPAADRTCERTRSDSEDGIFPKEIHRVIPDGTASVHITASDLLAHGGEAVERNIRGHIVHRPCRTSSGNEDAEFAALGSPDQA